jgi:AhpD family alkylhydroperoxidase
MELRAKELVAIAASVAGHCQPCFRHHLKKAREAGASEEDIEQTVELAKRISEIGDRRMAEFVEEVMREERP